MSDEKKQKIIVLDVLSYRGGNDEQERLGVEEIKWERLEEDKHITKSKHLDIIYKIIKILFDSSDGNMHLILSLCQVKVGLLMNYMIWLISTFLSIEKMLKERKMKNEID